MCGRYYRTADKQAIAEWFHAAAVSDDPMPPGYNIAPNTIQPVIRQRAPANWSGCVGAWLASARRAESEARHLQCPL
jgi:putative SOS response-associated peptidase YedK